MRISDWSSDVCSSDLCQLITVEHLAKGGRLHPVQQAMVDCHGSQCGFCTPGFVMSLFAMTRDHEDFPGEGVVDDTLAGNLCRCTRSEEHTSELQSLMRISYAVFCLKKKTQNYKL